MPTVTTVRIDRVELDVRGLDPSLVRSALELFPGALEGALEGAFDGPGGRPHPPRPAGPLRFDAAPAPAELARVLAERVAAEARRAGREP